VTGIGGSTIEIRNSTLPSFAISRSLRFALSSSTEERVRVRSRTKDEGRSAATGCPGAEEFGTPNSPVRPPLVRRSTSAIRHSCASTLQTAGRASHVSPFGIRHSNRVRPAAREGTGGPHDRRSRANKVFACASASRPTMSEGRAEVRSAKEAQSRTVFRAEDPKVVVGGAVRLLLGGVSVPNFYNFHDFTLRRLYGGGVSAKANASWSRRTSRSTLPFSSASIPCPLK
jgi:hypothetical protein